MICEKRFDNTQAMLEAMYCDVVTILAAALDHDDHISLLLSGGSTPKPLYQRLSGAELEWCKIHVGLVDERWVDAAHPASNERLLRETLMQHRASACRFLGMKNDSADPFEGELQCNAHYAALPAPFTLCLLGMGPDGHTASLFPGARGLDRALKVQQYCAAIEAQPTLVTGDNVERMTMTPWALMQSRKIILMITGEQKWQVYQRARTQSSPVETPVSIFLQQQDVDIDVYWAP